MIFLVFRIAFFAVFVGMHAALMVGLFLERRRDRPLKVDAAPDASADAPFVSIVIPFRNEERRMGALLESLARQDYPAREFILIDDGSEDGTAEKIAEFAAGRGDASIITLKENPGANRKQYALEKGIAAAKGSLLLFTDADCELPPRWVAAMAARMEDEKTGAAIGPVFKRELQNGARHHFFSTYQCFDHAVRYMYLAASTGLGAAGGGFGNNLILRRKALDEIGGYGSVPPSPTEDAALISRVRAATKYRIRAICGSDAAVFTAPENSWKPFVNQTLRWNNGGLFSPDGATRFNFAFLMTTISMGMLAIPAVPFVPEIWPLPAAVLLSMAANTAAVLLCFRKAADGTRALPRAGLLWIVQCVFTPMYFTFLTLLGLAGFKPAWKSADT